MRRPWWLLLFAVAPGRAEAGTLGDELEVWARSPGLSSEGLREQRDLRSVVLADLRLVEQELFDAQLGRSFVFRGINLADLLEGLPRPDGVDHVLLHFANGMIIPVELEGPLVKQVFLATAYKVGGAFDDHFPDVPKKKRALPDPAPITFGRNKIVVPDGAHPRVPKSAQANFSPWFYADTLTGLEWVVGARWERQFQVDGDATIRRGAEVFLGRCQFCHGVGEVGAAYGWDLVHPVPLYDYRRPDGLYVHVTVENAEALQKGYRMPPQKDVDRGEIQELWGWMKAVALKGPRPYGAD